ncbi:nucleoside-diphosphate-sugar epimerase [Azospirillum lipoferum]|nr:NAD-dependent epimerase/dehydratase family protein [Azospirillum lipoferum]MCP1615032.1 nucleoside-diphosphate-sugar epimerase [Azospirillum lipoferum]MDW5536937.1 NAD-dependent epimerase/dehydratase family protein [Azospirillum sp. NL1]
MTLASSNQLCVLLTGATGFVGRHLASHLAAHGALVHAVVRSGRNSNLLPPYITQHMDSEGEELARIIENVRPDIVFHLASLYITDHKPQDINILINSNVLFGARLMEAMSNAGVRRLVNTGTSWQHFNGDQYDPVNLYAATKQAFEAIISYYVSARGFSVTTLKLYDTYGPADSRPKLFHLLRNAAEKGETLRMSPGEQLLDIVHIKDVVEAFRLAGIHLLRGKSGTQDFYTVSSGRCLPLREIVGLFEKVIAQPIPVEWGARSYRTREVMQPWRGGNSVPGWTPEISLEDGLKDLIHASELS